MVAIKVNKFVLNLSEGSFCGNFKLIVRFAESGSLTCFSEFFIRSFFTNFKSLTPKT